jgi:hypothetical protein
VIRQPPFPLQQTIARLDEQREMMRAACTFTARRGIRPLDK